MQRTFLKLIKYACCCFIAFWSLACIVASIETAKKSPSILVLPALLVISGFYVSSSAKNKSLGGSGLIWWLYGVFVPVISWLDVAKAPIMANTNSVSESRKNPHKKEYQVQWEIWEMEHTKPEQRKRWMKALKDCTLVKMLDEKQGVAVVKGERGGEYTTSLSMCSCPDFTKRHKPCKHMYFLANYLDVFNPFDF